MFRLTCSGQYRFRPIGRRVREGGGSVEERVEGFWPEGWGPKGGGARTQKSIGPEGWGAQNFALGVFSWNFGGV